MNSLSFSSRQMQELENKFKDAYSQSLSTKDERIQVLEKRVEETSRDNAQLREDLATVKKQNDQLKEQLEAKAGSGTPGTSKRDNAAKYKEQVEVLHDTVRAGAPLASWLLSILVS